MSAQAQAAVLQRCTTWLWQAGHGSLYSTAHGTSVQADVQAGYAPDFWQLRVWQPDLQWSLFMEGRRPRAGLLENAHPLGLC